MEDGELIVWYNIRSNLNTEFKSHYYQLIIVGSENEKHIVVLINYWTKIEEFRSTFYYYF